MQEIAEFLRDVACSEKLFCRMDHSVFAVTPKDSNGDIVYECSLRTHDRVIKPLHHYALTFNFTLTQGLYNIKAEKDGIAVPVQDRMDIERFKALTKELLEVERLYKSPKQTALKRSRLVKDASSLQEVMEFMVSASVAKNDLHLPVDWMMQVVHPCDNNGDIGFEGWLLTEHGPTEPFPRPYNTLSFSYSKTCGIHLFKAYEDGCLIYQTRHLSFEDFKAFAVKLFRIEGMEKGGGNRKTT